jgi:hypothetical protein
MILYHFLYECANQIEKNTIQLPHTAGFFFGESTPDDLKYDREFIALTRAEIADGNTKGDARASPFEFSSYDFHHHQAMR